MRPINRPTDGVAWSVDLSVCLPLAYKDFILGV